MCALRLGDTSADSPPDPPPHPAPPYSPPQSRYRCSAHPTASTHPPPSSPRTSRNHPVSTTPKAATSTGLHRRSAVFSLLACSENFTRHVNLTPENRPSRLPTCKVPSTISSSFQASEKAKTEHVKPTPAPH